MTRPSRDAAGPTRLVRTAPRESRAVRCRGDDAGRVRVNSAPGCRTHSTTDARTFATCWPMSSPPVFVGAAPGWVPSRRFEFMTDARYQRRSANPGRPLLDAGDVTRPL